MLFRTEIDIPKADFEIGAAERMLFVGSCFADNLVGGLWRTASGLR